MNRVFLIGRTTRDIEMRYTKSGTPVALFTLAVNRREGGADFIRCKAWSKTAELMQKYVPKGSRVGINGRIETDTYERDGKRITSTEIVAEEVEFLERREPSDAAEPDAQPEPVRMEDFTPVDLPY